MINNIPSDVELEFNKCPMGCDSDDTHVFSGRDLLHDLPGEYAIVKCNSCQLLRTSPRPTAGTIGYYYPKNYGPYEATKITKGVEQSSHHSFLKRLLRAINGSNSNCLPDQMPGRMLEVGCASGSFMFEMEKKGWETQGIEFSEDASANARSSGLSVFTGTIETAPEPDHPYDLVVAWMVLEHLHDPVLALQKLRSWTKTDGWLVVSVPNASAWSFKFFKNNWYDLHMPNHLFHFTPNTIQNILFESGWDMGKVNYQQNISSPIASIGYMLQNKGYLQRVAQSFVQFPSKGPRWGYRAVRPLAFIQSMLHQSSRITVWARPRK